jgi:hypothetical protein
MNDTKNHFEILGMTVQELIDELNKIKNKNAVVFAFSGQEDASIFLLGTPVEAKVYYDGTGARLNSSNSSSETIHDGVIL